MQHEVTVADALSGIRIDTIPCSAFTWERLLSAGGAAQVTLVYDGTLSRSQWRDLTAPWRHLIALERGGRVEFIGYISGDSYSVTSRTKTVPLLDLWGLAERRGAWDHNEPNMEKWRTTVTGSLAHHAAQALLRGRTGPSHPSMMIPVHIGGQPGTPAISRTYYGYFLENVSDVWDGLMAEGLDIYLRPEQRPDNLGIHWRFLAGNGWTSGLEHEYWVNADESPISDLAQRTDATRVTNNARWVGEGSEEDMLVRSQRNSSSPLPLLDRIDSAKTVPDVASLSRRAAQTLVTYGEPTVEWSFKVLAREAPDVGDTVHLWFDGDLEIPDGKHTRRVVRVNGDLGDSVTVTCQPAGGA